MPFINFGEIPVANSGKGDQDYFELFARDFFWSLGYVIDEGPSRGADGGKDLIVVEPLAGIVSRSEKRWLVSCKHFVHSGTSVSDRDEPDIIGRVEKFKCDGFIGFYSTLPSSGLANTLKALQDRIDIEIFDRARIEHFLVTEDPLRAVLLRYFPEGYKSVAQNYTWEKLYTAILTLASGQFSLQERLADAYISSLMRLRPEDLPRGLRDEFIELGKRLTCVEPEGDEGSVYATVRAMDTETARGLAEKIVSMYDRYRVNLIDDLRS
jgi:hypothetical protein